MSRVLHRLMRKMNSGEANGGATVSTSRSCRWAAARQTAITSQPAPWQRTRPTAADEKPVAFHVTPFSRPIHSIIGRLTRQTLRYWQSTHSPRPLPQPPPIDQLIPKHSRDFSVTFIVVMFLLVDGLGGVRGARSSSKRKLGGKEKKKRKRSTKKKRKI